MVATPERDPSPWREALLQSFVRWTTVLGGLVGLIVALQALASGGLRSLGPGGLWMYSAYLGFVSIQFLRRVPLPIRAAALCFTLQMVAGGAILMRGLGPGPVMVLAVSVVITSLFFRRIGLVASLGGAATLVAVLGGPERTAPYSSLVSTIAFAHATGALAVVVMFVVRKLELAHDEAARAVRELRAEQSLREQTQADLARAQVTLYQSQKLDAIGRLAAGVAHDFNNTLQVVLGWSHILAQTQDWSEVRESGQQIRAAGEHSRGVTRQLMAFSRPELRSPCCLELDDFLGGLVRSYRRLLPEDIEIELEVEPRLTLVADQAQLSQVLLNLVLNARDAMTAGGKLTVSAKRLEPGQLPPAAARRLPSAAVMVSVSDTGIGMDEATKIRVFEPFFTTKGARGTGLGLWTVYGVVNEAHGAVEIDSRPTAGTTVSLFFPVTPAPARPRSSAVAPAADPRTPGRRVLLVDDEEGVRRSLALAIGRAGFAVVEAADVADARTIVEREGPGIDILVTDGIMPGGRTRDLISDFLSVRSKGRVIICSGYIGDELSSRELRGRNLEYLPKPFAPPVLVERLLAGRRAIGNLG